jgi:hypothetical protein
VNERDVLLQAMMNAEGLPECSAEEYAQRVVDQLQRIGYDLVKRPEPFKCSEVAANKVHYPHAHGPDGKPRCAGWTWTQANTVDGIRPHLPRTPEQDALERRLAEDMLRTTPATIPPELLP